MNENPNKINPHTPGPWRFLMEEDGDEETGGYGVDCWNGQIIAGAGGVAYEDICNVWPRDEANGQLIAAAPDLLAACDEISGAYFGFYSALLADPYGNKEQLVTPWIEKLKAGMTSCKAAARKARGDA